MTRVGMSTSLLCDWLLQTLYAAMHEPDGVTGVNALRREEPSLREQILEHESIGLLRDATACYDRAIQLESDQVHTHRDTHSTLCVKCGENSSPAKTLMFELG